jgi:predicted RecB family nuclease
MDAFGDPAQRDPVNPFVQLLWERGTLFEKETIEKLTEPFLDLSGFRGDEKERETREAIANGTQLIYSGRLSNGDLLGEPDLLRREGNGYVAIDIKSGAGEEGGDDESGEEGKPKKRYGVQVALYTELLQSIGASAGRYAYIWDIHGVETRYEFDVPLGPRTPPMSEIYEQVKTDVRATLARTTTTEPALAGCCKLCVWRSACRSAMDGIEDLTLIAELGRSKRETLKPVIGNLRALAEAEVERYLEKGGKKTTFKGIGPGTLTKLRARAILLTTDGAQPYLTQALPPLEGNPELFFDIETDPLRDRCYLHGFVIRDGRDNTTERFEAIFAEDVTDAAEEDAFARAMDIFRRFPQGLVVYYSPYERTEYRKLQRKFPRVCGADEIEALYSEGRSFDLYSDGTRKRSEWPTNDFSIKTLAKNAGFQWRDADPSGASSIDWFHQWVNTRDPATKQRLLDYNEDDCRAMRVVLDALRQMEMRAEH